MPERPDTFATMWRRTVADHSANTFLVFRADDGSDSRWTYAEFDQIVRRVAATLHERGVGPGDAVHLVLRNSPLFIAAWLAVAHLGAWFVPVDPASTGRDIASHIRRVHPRLSIIAESRAAAFLAGAPDAPALRVAEDHRDLIAGAELVAAPPMLNPHPARLEDLLAVMFTSGTTAEPKGVQITQANYRVVGQAMAREARLTAIDRYLVTLPLFHANAQYYCFAPAIAAGASVALTSAFSASRWVAQARQLEATHASLFAAPIRMILARTPEPKDVLSLQHVWFAQSLGEQHHQAFAELAGTFPRQLYGMTETVAIVTADRSEPPTHDTIGPPIPGRRVRVVDPATGEDAEPGEPGELWVNGRRGVDLFLGYLDAADINDRAFAPASDDSVWFRTGDVVSRDSDDVLRFVGRVDDVIKVSGENVSLTEIEAAAAQAPGVLEAAIVARSDPIRDQVPVAYVVPKNPVDPPTASDLDAWAQANLTPAARPREWHLIDELPRTSVGKVRRFRIGT